MVEVEVEGALVVPWARVVGESLRRRAACPSAPSHAVPGNDPQLRAMLQEHVPCREVRRY